MTTKKQQPLWFEEPAVPVDVISNLACIACGKIITGKTIQNMKCEHCDRSILVEDNLNIYEKQKNIQSGN